jgi:hypothetical protein
VSECDLVKRYGAKKGTKIWKYLCELAGEDSTIKNTDIGHPEYSDEAHAFRQQLAEEALEEIE